MSQPNGKFELGQQVATPGALRAIHQSGESLLHLISRHLCGDWGDLDAEDKKSNDAALLDGSRIFSAYILKTGEKIWVITEAVGDDGTRASTCATTPDEY
ncbi:hypothetical protein J0H58_12735 [bacterium]|nr:hypothetical protein [bacterium]